jgi:hypothetical protein
MNHVEKQNQDPSRLLEWSVMCPTGHCVVYEPTRELARVAGAAMLGAYPHAIDLSWVRCVSDQSVTLAAYGAARMALYLARTESVRGRR